MPAVPVLGQSRALDRRDHLLTGSNGSHQTMKKLVKPFRAFLGFILAAVLLAAFAPVEKTLGVNARLVYFHGAWVWVALLCFAAAALAGLAGLITRHAALHAWSRALGRVGLLFWIIFLGMSLLVMQANWNGLYLDEPRFRVPLNFAIIGLLLQAGLSFFPNPAWTSLANLIFGSALLYTMSGVQTVLHPDSPVLQSQISGIQIFFAGEVLLLCLAAWQLAWLLLKLEQKRRG